MMRPGAMEASSMFAGALASFANQQVDNSSIIIHYSVAGDASVNGIVNALDFNALASNFGATGQPWLAGDFTYDGIVNSADFGLLSANFSVSVPAAAVVSSAAAPLATLLFSDKPVFTDDNVLAEQPVI